MILLLLLVILLCCGGGYYGYGRWGYGGGIGGGLGLVLLLVVLYLLFGDRLRAETPPVPFAVRVYYVTNPATFPSVGCGRGLLYRNGLFQSPGIDYTVGPSGACVFPAPFLSAGDQVEVATVP